MDKQAFNIQSFYEADIQTQYWKSKSIEERLSAAMEMTLVAYHLRGIGFQGMDKQCFTAKKRNG